MSMRYIRDTYGVPAQRGRPVTYQGRPAVITSAPGHYLNLRLTDTTPGQRVGPCHPTWRIDYFPDVATPHCPTHGIPDCSPLLNGCSRLTNPDPL